VRDISPRPVESVRDSTKRTSLLKGSSPQLYMILAKAIISDSQKAFSLSSDRADPSPKVSLNLAVDWAQKYSCQKNVFCQHLCGLISSCINSGSPPLTSLRNPRLSILLVEDNSLNRGVVKHMVESLGHSCDVACDGDEAVNLSDKKKYDLILMDMNMPRMKGSTAAGIIKKGGGLNSHTSITLLSGSDEETICEQSLLVFDHYLRKPIDLKCLNRRLPEILIVKGPTAS